MKEFIWQLDIRMVYAVLIIAQTIVAYMAGSTTYKLSSEHIMSKAYKKFNSTRIDKINEMLLNTKNDKNNYEVIEHRLKSYGYKYYFANMQPYRYVQTKILGAVAGVIIGMLLGTFFEAVILTRIVLGVIGGILGYNAIDLYTIYLNKQDNEAIVDDVRIIMAAMRVQGSANVFITDIITECYYEIKNKRFKKALLELTGEIRAKQDINDAVDEMKNKFNNRYIDSLCTVIKQLLKSGRSSNMIDYINKQMTALQREMITKEKRKTDTDKIVSTFIIFILIMMFIFSSMQGVLTTTIV